jgi:hypothetical protein
MIVQWGDFLLAVSSIVSSGWVHWRGSQEGVPLGGYTYRWSLKVDIGGDHRKGVP